MELPHLLAHPRFLIGLHKQLATTKNPHDKEMLQRQIDVVDRKIDGLVYELYELTEEEVKIIEAS